MSFEPIPIDSENEELIYLIEDLFSGFNNWKKGKDSDIYKEICNFNGSIGELLQKFKSDQGLQIQELVIYPIILIKGVIEYKITQNKMGIVDSSQVELIRYCYEFMSDLYIGFKNPQLYVSKIQNFEDYLKNNFHGEILKYNVNFEADSATINSYNQVNLRAAVKRIEAKSYGAKVLALSMANGAIATGMAIILDAKLKRIIDSHSTVYPIRFSRSKGNDNAPRISVFEWEFFDKLVEQGFEIHIIEEDIYTGETTRIMANLLIERYPNKKIFVNWFVNHSDIQYSSFDYSNKK